MNALEEIARALAWALLHSLWQAALVALALSALLRSLRVARPQTRHALCLLALLSALLLPVWTFLGLLSLGSAAPSPIGTDGAAAEPPLWPVALALVWGAGVLLMGARLGAGLLRLRVWVAEARPEPALAAAARRIGETLGLRAGIRVLQSARIAVPATVGWIRPVLLFPVGLAAELTPRQVELVLAHELAHVRRLDFLVNLLQSMVEALLFHNPAVWWISNRLRQEREFCCDDRAVSVLGGPADLARALAGLEARRQGVQLLSVPADGGSLMLRIRRLIEPRSRSTAGRGLLALSILSTLLLLSLVLSGTSAACEGTTRTLKLKPSDLPLTLKIELAEEEPAEPETEVLVEERQSDNGRFLIREARTVTRPLRMVLHTSAFQNVPARVSIVSKSPAGRTLVLTPPKFQLEGLEPGVYQLRVAPAGDGSMRYELILPDDPPEPAAEPSPPSGGQDGESGLLLSVKPPLPVDGLLQLGSEMVRYRFSEPERDT